MATQNRVSLEQLFGACAGLILQFANLWIRGERDIKFRDGNGVLIAMRWLSLGVKAGDSISLTTARGKATAFGSVPVRRKFKIAGIFNVGMLNMTPVLFLCLLIFQRNSWVMKAYFRFRNLCVFAGRNRVFRQQVDEMVGPGLRVFDWIERNSSFLNALKVEQVFLNFDLFLLVAHFNIISSVMLVRSKDATDNLLRTMGASGGSIIRVF